MATTFSREPMPVCHSYITFGDEASFKKLELHSSDHQVLHYCQLKRKIKKRAKEIGQVLTEVQLQSLFNKLYPLSQVDEAIKKQHIQTIKEKAGN